MYYPDIELYRDAVDGFINVMDHLAKQVEQEKRDAIIVSNKLASLPNKIEEEMGMLQVCYIKQNNVLEVLLLMFYISVSNRTENYGTRPLQN